MQASTMHLSIIPRSILVTNFIITFIIPQTVGLKTLCYWTNWSRARTGHMQLRPQDIDPHLCTHLIYAFAAVERLDIVRTRYDDTGGTEPGYTLFNNLKRQNKELVTLLSLGGAVAGPTAFDEPAASPENRQTFAANTVRYLRRWNFDGVDIDWEYPVNGTQFTLFLQALRSAFDDEAVQTSKQRLLLTAAVSVGEERINEIYDIPALNRTVDFLNVMAYDFHGSWGGLATFNSPLYSRLSNPKVDPKLSQDWAIRQYIEKGMHPSKITLGLASYGRAYQLTDRQQHGVVAPIKPSTIRGSILKEREYRMYPEVCEFITQNNARYHFDEEQKCPFVYTIDFWIGYDDTRSFSVKTQYAIDNKLGGMLLWALDYDDINGRYCRQGSFPLVNAIKSTIAGQTERIPLLPPLGYLPDSLPPRKVEEPTDLYKKVCYFTNWSLRRKENAGQFNLLNVNTDICTHLVYAFVFVDEIGFSLLPVYNNDESVSSAVPGNFEVFNKLKQIKKTLKTLLSVGGVTAGSRPFDIISKNDTTRRRFASNVITYLHYWGFDGLDIAWEFPGELPETKRQFTLLVEVLGQEFDKHATQHGGARLILSAAVAAEAEQIDKGYEIDKLSKYLDFINVLTYTYKRKEKVTYMVSPLHPIAGDNATARLNQEWSIDRWIKGGAPAKKLLLGLTGMGRSFDLEYTSFHAPGDQVRDDEVTGPILGAKGVMMHYEICDFINRGAHEVYDSDQVGAYMYHRNLWVGYENRQSIQKKVAWLKNRSLGGYFFWSLDYDDFTGTHCNCGRFPLLTAAHQAVEGENTTCPGESGPNTTFSPNTTFRPKHTLILDGTFRTDSTVRPDRTFTTDSTIGADHTFKTDGTSRPDTTVNPHSTIIIKTESSGTSLRAFPHLLGIIAIAQICSRMYL